MEYKILSTFFYGTGSSNSIQLPLPRSVHRSVILLGLCFSMRNVAAITAFHRCNSEGKFIPLQAGDYLGKMLQLQTL